MIRLIARLTPLLLLASILHGQQSDAPKCPTITVTGPAGVVLPGETAMFMVAISPVDSEELELEYLWSTSSGEIVRGQGTTLLGVRPESTHCALTATVNIKGFPPGCPNSMSEHLNQCDGPPISVKLGQFELDSFKRGKHDLDEVLGEMLTHEDSQLYVIVAYDKMPINKTVVGAERRAVTYLTSRRLARERITMVRAQSSARIIQFWRVPPGAENPACDVC